MSKVASISRQVLSGIKVNSLAAGGRRVEEKLQTLRSKFLPPEFPRARDFNNQMAVRSLWHYDTRGPLLDRIVKGLPLERATMRVAELYAGGMLSGPALLLDNHYTMVSDDPFFLALGQLPEPLIAAFGLGELAGINPFLLTSLPSETQKTLNELLRAMFPNLSVYQMTIDDFIAIHSSELGKADLTLKTFWGKVVTREMELFTRPGGFMVTLDLKSGGHDDWSGGQSGEIAQLTASRPRPDLSGPINKSLNRVAGYRQLGLRVTVAQKELD